MRAPDLSIIIPTLNEAAGIAAALEPLQPLRQRGAEVIVVDGGSGDATRALAAPLADRVLTAPRGRAVQMNAGAAIARGTVLLFLHADCVVPENADRLIADNLRAHRGSWGRFDVRLDGAHPLFRVIEFMMNLRSRATGIATGDQGLFVTRELFAAAGGFPRLPLMEDIALCKILKSRAAPVCLGARIAVAVRRWQQHGILRTVVLMWRLRLAYFLGASPADLALRYEGSRARR